jgi:hypothetical protein
MLTSSVSAEGFFDFLFGPTPTPTPVPEIDLSIVNETETFTDFGYTTTVIYEGILIKNKSKTHDKNIVVKEETEKILKNITFPYSVIQTEYTFYTIEKFRCDNELCGYWISAYRDGYEVQTNSPIWIRNPPYHVIVSESYNETHGHVVLKEDPKGAVEQVLQRYVDNQPLGIGVVGTPA